MRRNFSYCNKALKESKSMPRHILVVDDDPHIREVVTFALEKAGMDADEASDGAEVMNKFDERRHQLIVLDISMPEMDGLDVCREIRKTSDVPILFLSSRDEEIDRIIGLEIGADDYLTKPFSPRELIARIKAILKRTQPKTENNHVNETFRAGGLLIEPAKHQASWNGEELSLTATEFSILSGMIRYPEMVYNRDQIMDMAYAHDIHVSDRTIDSHIRHIRQKFASVGCEEVIKTVHGVGYRLSS